MLDFKKMKLGTKIILGFASGLLILVILGTLAVWSMSRVKTDSTALAVDYTPEVKVGNGIQYNLLMSLFEMRAYSYSEDAAFLEKARPYIEETNKAIAEAHAISANSKNLAEFNAMARKAETAFKLYQEQIKQTTELTERLIEDRNALQAEGKKYMESCYAYLTPQNEQLRSGIAQGADSGRLKEILTKSMLINDAIDLGNWTQIALWQAQGQRDEKILEKAMDNFEQIKRKLDQLAAITREDAQNRQLAEIKRANDEYRIGMAKMIKDWSAMDVLNKDRLESALNTLAHAVNAMENGLGQTTTIANESANQLRNSSSVMVIGVIIGLLVGIGLALIVTRSITGPLNRVIRGLSNGAGQIASASSQVSQTSQVMAEGASEQASSLEMISSSLEEMASMTKQNADNARQANSVSAEARAAAEKGSQVMEKMTGAINQIKISSDETAKIVKTIDEIAFQTNLLALNAAVEAARAGEAGKGFAVVAEEVRNLAQRSAEAAKNTSALIEESQKNSENGVAVSNEVAEILKRIVEGSQGVTQLVSGVSAASDEQARGIEQITKNISQMDKVTQSNASTAEESASASEELSAEARELRGIVGTLVDMVGDNNRDEKNDWSESRHRAETGAGGHWKIEEQQAHLAHPHGNGGNGQGKKSGAPHPSHIQLAAAKNHLGKAADIIPLDEEEMKQF